MKDFWTEIARVTISSLLSAAIMMVVWVCFIQFPKLINIKADVVVTQVFPNAPETSSTFTVKGDVRAYEK